MISTACSPHGPHCWHAPSVATIARSPPDPFRSCTSFANSISMRRRSARSGSSTTSSGIRRGCGWSTKRPPSTRRRATPLTPVRGSSSCRHRSVRSPDRSVCGWCERSTIGRIGSGSSATRSMGVLMRRGRWRPRWSRRTDTVVASDDDLVVRRKSLDRRRTPTGARRRGDPRQRRTGPAGGRGLNAR